jgi:hypothetical protein
MPVDGEIRAVHSAEVTTAAFFGGYCVWWMVSLGVKGVGKSEHLTGTKFNTETTRFTSFDNNRH